MSAALDIDDLKARFLNKVFDEITFSTTAAKLVDYAKTCGEVAPRYTDPRHPDRVRAGRDAPAAPPGHGGQGRSPHVCPTQHRPP